MRGVKWISLFLPERLDWAAVWNKYVMRCYIILDIKCTSHFVMYVRRDPAFRLSRGLSLGAA